MTLPVFKIGTDLLLELTYEALRLLNQADEAAQNMAVGGVLTPTFELYDEFLPEDLDSARSLADRVCNDLARWRMARFYAVTNRLTDRRSHFFELSELLQEHELAECFNTAIRCEWQDVIHDYDADGENEFIADLLFASDFGHYFEANEAPPPQLPPPQPPNDRLPGKGTLEEAGPHEFAWNEKNGDQADRLLSRLRNRLCKWARSRGLLITADYRVVDCRDLRPDGIRHADPEASQTQSVTKPSSNRQCGPEKTEVYAAVLAAWKQYSDKEKSTLPKIPGANRGGKKHFAHFYAEQFKLKQDAFLLMLGAAEAWRKRNPVHG